MASTDLYTDGPFAFVVEPDGMVRLTVVGNGTCHFLHLFPHEINAMYRDYDDMAARAKASKMPALR